MQGKIIKGIAGFYYVYGEDGELYECKAKGIPVNVLKPVAFGTFYFPAVVLTDTLSVSISGKLDPVVLARLRDQIEQALPTRLKAASSSDTDVDLTPV